MDVYGTSNFNFGRYNLNGMLERLFIINAIFNTIWYKLFFSTKATNGRKQWIILDTIIYLFLLLVVFIFYR